MIHRKAFILAIGLMALLVMPVSAAMLDGLGVSSRPSQAPPAPPVSNAAWIKGAVYYVDVNGDVKPAANTYIYAAYSNGTPIEPLEGTQVNNITSATGNYSLIVPKPEDNIVKICIADGVYCVNVNVSSATMIQPAVVNILVPRANLSTLLDYINNPSKSVLMVVGNGSKWGPLRWAANRQADQSAEGYIAQVFPPNAKVDYLLDGAVANWNNTKRRVEWRSIASNYSLVVTVGGVGVNAVTWRYGFKPDIFIGIDNETSYPYLQLSNGKIIYNSSIKAFVFENATGVYNVTEVPALQVSKDKYGKTDFALVYVVRDLPANKTVIVVEGLTSWGTTAAGVWLRQAVSTSTLPADKALVVLSWQDVNDNGLVDPDEINVIYSS